MRGKETQTAQTAQVVDGGKDTGPALSFPHSPPGPQLQEQICVVPPRRSIPLPPTLLTGVTQTLQCGPIRKLLPVGFISSTQLEPNLAAHQSRRPGHPCLPEHPCLVWARDAKTSNPNPQEAV